jgi:hypothetical protein
MLEDESVIDDEDVFSAFPNNTCFLLADGFEAVRVNKVANPTHVNDHKQKRLTFETGTLDLRCPNEQVNLSFLLICYY